LNLAGFLLENYQVVGFNNKSLYAIENDYEVAMPKLLSLANQLQQHTTWWHTAILCCMPHVVNLLTDGR
jgi:hypothetical protein